MRALLRELLSLVLPGACARCGRSMEDGEPLCAVCARALPQPAAASCARCQQAPACQPGQRCLACATRRDPLAACVAGVWFRGEVEVWIRRFKYPPRGLARVDAEAPVLARALVRLAARRAPGGAPDRVVPVPLHARALRRRGFNPAALLARELARAAGAPLYPTALRRLRDTPSQTGLDRAARRRNVRGAFRARGPQPAHVWLVDDVVTTGATLEAAARALRRAGARRIVALCAARTPAP